jgi:segregation and condensation protein A
MTNYEVKLEKFTGPLDKLLQLIEGEHLEITQINLAEVTADFLDYVKKIGEEAEPEVLSDFLVVAAKLVLIKSKALLPTLELTKEEEGDIRNLEDRLKIYKEFKAAAQHIERLWNRGERSLSRPLLSALGEADRKIFYPPEKLSAEEITETLKRILQILKEFFPETQKVKDTVIKLEDKIQELVDRLQTVAEHSFKTLTKERPKKEMVVLFLAILHLLRERLIAVEQKEQFSDIIFRKMTNS